MTAPRDAQHWRTLDAPFTPADAWQPTPGRCTRCGNRAWRGEKRWWHDGQHCPARGRTAEFQAD